MDNKVKIPMPHDQIALFCRTHHIKRLALFGSVLTDRFGSESDIDILVDFEPGQVVGLIGMAKLEHELSDILGRHVDLRTPADLSRYFRDEVLASAEVQYAA
jgi:uncharacterized protein